jgi:enoyl-CoA hydratase/carnithine racemase
MNYETLIVERAEPVVTVTLNRPAKLNAVNKQMLEELAQVVAELRGDTATRFVILTGAGRAFSAGADLGQGREGSAEGPPPHVEGRLGQLASHDLIRNLQNLEQVTIAAVNGYCLGAGLVFAMVCDFIIVAQDAQLGVPETNVGIFYTWGSSARLSRLVGPLWAKDMIMTCENVSGEQAVAIGLANRVVPPGQLMAAARETVDKIAGKSPIAVRLTKKLVNAATAPGPGDVFLVEPELVERNYLSGDPSEGGRAFMEKRTPKFGSG